MAPADSAAAPASASICSLTGEHSEPRRQPRAGLVAVRLAEASVAANICNEKGADLAGRGRTHARTLHVNDSGNGAHTTGV
jgi:hypothetical protein